MHYTNAYSLCDADYISYIYVDIYEHMFRSLAAIVFTLPRCMRVCVHLCVCVCLLSNGNKYYSGSSPGSDYQQLPNLRSATKILLEAFVSI